MKVWVLGSGSRGNATVIDNGSTRLLVDAGFSARELKQRFAVAGIAPQSIDALIITHEHGDHMCGAVSAARPRGMFRRKEVRPRMNARTTASPRRTRPRDSTAP